MWVPIDKFVGSCEDTMTLRESIRELGLNEPITGIYELDRGYVIVDGHKRVHALRALGATELFVIRKPGELTWKAICPQEF